jgi:hypothetical protein
VGAAAVAARVRVAVGAQLLREPEVTSELPRDRGYGAMGLWGYGAMGLWGYGLRGYGLRGYGASAWASAPQPRHNKRIMPGTISLDGCFRAGRTRTRVAIKAK